MGRIAIIICGAVAGTPAAADPWHLGSFAGHSHWLAAGAFGAAALGALLGILRGAGSTGAGSAREDDAEMGEDGGEPGGEAA